MAAEIPFYLQVTTNSSDAVGIQDALKLDWNYDYDKTPSKTPTKSVWEDIADTTSSSLSKANDLVWDTAKGTWDTAKSGITSALAEVKNAGTGLFDSATGIFDSLLMRIVLIFAVVVIGLMFLSKSGALSEIVKGIGMGA